MRKAMLVLLSLTLAVPLANPVRSADMFCICPKMPMYSVGGGNWFHYAVVCKQGNMPGCIDQYPTGWTGAPAFSKSCSNTPNGCINCNALGSAASSVPELYFGILDDPAPLYSKLNDANEIKDFIKSVDGLPSSVSGKIYDYMTFSRPYPRVYDDPIAVKLSRDVKGTTEDFYAIVWRMRDDQVEERISVGFEVSGDIPPKVVVAPVSFCNAVITSNDTGTAVTHTAIPGLLKVQLFNGKDEVAYIRLQNSTKNKDAEYPPCM